MNEIFKEQFGGYHWTECADHDEAVTITRGIPTLRVEGRSSCLR
jgi:hypothetical protein